LLQALWLAAPVIIAGALHIFAIRHDVLPWLARPLDGGATVRGRRLFGDNKTIRGIVLMVTFTTLCAMAQSWMTHRFEWARELTLPGVSDVAPALWGALLGAGYVLGELPNSLVKRQLMIGPGEAARGWMGPVFWVLDQIDSLIGAVAALSIVWMPPLSVVMAMLVVTLTVHPLAALSMVALGLKDRIG
jgi:hypothetical protein